MEAIWRRARNLRRNATDGEQQFWRFLKGRQRAGFKFRRRFPVVGFVADFACVEARLVIELDGSQHLDAAEYDARRSRRMERNGYLVLRYWNDDVLRETDTVLEDIHRYLIRQSR